MHFDGAYRFIGTIDPQPLLRMVETFDEESWFENLDRQEAYYPHRRTQTIPLLYDKDGRHCDPTAWPRMALFEPILEPVLNLIRAANPPISPDGDDGYFIRILLTRLNPHCWINGHHDSGDTMLRSHRYHLAIATDERVQFEVAEDVRHLAAGEIWEINNRAHHAVRNASDTARIHMILDYVVPGERIEDPEGLVIA